MKSCHRRIERFLQTLKKIGQCRELDAQHAEALRKAIDYFKSAGPRHNEDEDVSLFPALAASADAAGAAAMQRMRQLAEEHAAAEKLHHRIDELAETWLKSGKISDTHRREFQGAVETLISIYTPHIAMEETDIFPLAAKVLDSSTLLNIGDQMRSRRADNPGREGRRCAQRRQQYPS